MKYEIIYTNNKHNYAKFENWKLIIKLSKILKNKPKLEQQIIKSFIEKASKFKKTTTINLIWNDYVYIRWKKMSDPAFFNKYANQYHTTNKNELLIKILENYIWPRIKKLSSILWFKNTKFKIKNLKSIRWRCSHKNELLFNLKLIWLEKPIVDYVIVHECCHLIYKNHQKEFWNLVSKYYPDYKEAIQKLKNIKIN